MQLEPEPLPIEEELMSNAAMDEAKSGPCFHCHKPTGPDDYCYGCGKNVCQKCHVNNALQGIHRPSAHLIAKGQWVPPCGVHRRKQIGSGI